MQLPATYNEARQIEAVHFARRMLDRFFSTRLDERADEAGPWSGMSGPMVSAEAGHAFLAHLLPALLRTYEGRTALIAMAKLGFGEAADVLRRYALEMRSLRQLPVECETYG